MKSNVPFKCRFTFAETCRSTVPMIWLKYINICTRRVHAFREKFITVHRKRHSNLAGPCVLSTDTYSDVLIDIYHMESCWEQKNGGTAHLALCCTRVHSSTYICIWAKPLDPQQVSAKWNDIRKEHENNRNIGIRIYK